MEFTVGSAAVKNGGVEVFVLKINFLKVQGLICNFQNFRDQTTVSKALPTDVADDVSVTWR